MITPRSIDVGHGDDACGVRLDDGRNVATSILASQAASPARRPNVLFVITDQQRADHVGFSGNRVVRTPQLDNLAARSMVFDRAFVANPVCMPNRSTIMTGRMPSAHGVVFNDRSLQPNANTFVSRLRRVGYRTALIGKSHLQHGMSRDTFVDLPGEAGLSNPWGDDWDTIEHQERYECGDFPDPDDFYGFEHIELAIGHGAVAGGHHYLWARAQGASHEQLVAGHHPDTPVPRRSPLWWQIHAAPYPAELHSTSFVTDRTVAFIEDAHSSGEPWVVWCSYPDPHHPLAAPEPWFGRHDPADIDLPPSFHDDGAGWPAHLSFLRSLGPSHDRFVMPFGPTPEQTRAAIAATYDMVEFVDHGVGRVLDAIDRLGATGDTIVVFTSDHGDMMGDHGLMLKGAMHYSGCIRVPLVVHVPGMLAGRTRSLASSIDLPHTVLDLCGVDEYQGMQGRSLRKVLDDPAASVRDHVLIEDDFPPRATGPGLPLKTRTLVSDGGRYTRDTEGQEQLFDLEHDPQELRDLTINRRDLGRRAGMVDRLADALIAADDLCRPGSIREELTP